MNRAINRRTALLFSLALLGGGAAALADDRDHGDGDRDHERARKALEEGQALPLTEILERVRHKLDGEVIGVEFDRRRNRYVYEFKVIGADGRLREIRVDALSADILRIEDEE